MSISAPNECADQIDSKLPKLVVAGSNPVARSVLICDSDESEYFSWPLINASKLKKLLESPIAYRDIYIEKTATIAESDAFRFGKIIHSSWQLGNEDFYSRSEDATGKEVTATGALSASGRVRERELAEEGKFLLTPQDHEKLNGIRRNALELPLVQQLLENRTAAEFNIRCSINGHACKGRIDLATPDGFADWKTTRDPRPLTDFPRSAMRFGYDLQAAFYNLLGQQAGWPDHSMTFVVMSTVWPYEVAAAPLPMEVVKRAERLAIRLLEELEVRTEWDCWQRYETLDVQEFSVPAYMMRRD